MASKIIREIIHQPSGDVEVVAICDAAADVTALDGKYSAGSIAFVPGGSVYVADTDGNFVEDAE